MKKREWEPEKAIYDYSWLTKEQLIDNFRAWSKEACDSNLSNNLDSEMMSKLTGIICCAIMNRDYDLLIEFRNFMVPHAADLADKLIELNITNSAVQAAEIGVLTAVVNYTLLQLELLIPQEAIKKIKYGKLVLMAIKAGNFDIDNVMFHMINDMRIEISKATLLRTIYALNMTWFIRDTFEQEDKRTFKLTSRANDVLD